MGGELPAFLPKGAGGDRLDSKPGFPEECLAQFKGSSGASHVEEWRNGYWVRVLQVDVFGDCEWVHCDGESSNYIVKPENSMLQPRGTSIVVTAFSHDRRSTVKRL